MPLPTLSSTPVASGLSGATPAATPAAATAAQRLPAWLGRLGLAPEGRRWAALALLLLVAGGMLMAWAMRETKKPAPGLLPDAPSLPSASTGPAPSIPLAVRGPAEVVEPAPAQGAQPMHAAASAAALPGQPGRAAEALPDSASSAAGSPTPTMALPAAQAASLASDLKALLEQQQRQAERIEHLKQQLGQQLAGVTSQLTRLQAQRGAAARAARQAVAAAAAAPASAPASAPAPARAQLLAVDLWDGKPSVVIGTDAAGDRRVRFMSEGDRQSDIAVKQASPQDQRAVFDVAGREVVLERGSAR